MGVNLRPLLIREEISIPDLKGKVIAFDAFNMLFQFLSNIRSPDGSLLTNKKGQVTSHLIGLFSRTTRFMLEGIKPVFVFDGESSPLKNEEIKKRQAAKKEAKKQYDDALAREDTVEMKKYAARTTVLTKEMCDHAKQLLTLLGLPVIQAPSEGEAQAAHLTNTGQAYAVGSQDYDSLLFGATNLIQNLSIAGRRKKMNAQTTIIVKPQQLNLEQNLTHLGITREQLIALAILVGTDFSPKGIKGIGPKTALKLIKEQKDDFATVFDKVNWSTHVSTPWKDIFELFTKTPVHTNITISFGPIDYGRLREFLIQEHDFSVERVENTFKELQNTTTGRTQKTLSNFFT